MNVSDFGINIGKLERGTLNSICDVDGVRVGHATIDTPEHKTGVTVVIPAGGNIFRDKLVGASFVLNGFGKTLGLVQVDELGTLETPIALTNTLNVGLVHDALVEYTLTRCDADGVRVASINPVVCECNDASLNLIRERAVTKEHVFKAIESAGSEFELGDVGCGKGTTCHGLKGGVGTASRVFDIGDRRFTVGVLMQTNHGQLGDLRIDGKDVGPALTRAIDENLPDKGSCITVVGTDLPLSSRQLRRVLKRAAIGLVRNGSYLGHGSGDIFVGFSTANRLRADKNPIRRFEIIDEEQLDIAFRACAEASEEAVLSSMLNAHKTTGYSGKVRYTLSDLLKYTE